MEIDNVYINYVEVIPGLDFFHSIYPAQKDQTDRHESDGETVDLCFILSGHILISASYLLHPGQCILFSCHREFTYQYPATERIHLLGFSTRRQLLKGMLNGLSDQVPPEMQNVINPDIAHPEGQAYGAGKSQETGAQENLLGHEFYCYIQSITAPMKVILHQLLNCPYRGGMERIFYESKFFELLFHMMDRTEGKEVSPVINDSDKMRINEIKALLKDNLEDPLALAELAKKAGMSTSKLKRTFPLITGETVYGYLRKKRMEKAMDLLRQEISITEVAYSVGYESISAFTKTFNKYYGLTPSALRSTLSLRDKNLSLKS